MTHPSTEATRRIRTVHLVYPHGPSISTPDTIGRKVGERLERRYRVIYHDWSARYRIESRPDEALVGHPHPLPGTVFRRSSRAKGWGRVLMLAPFVDDPVQVAFEDAIIGDCDLFLAVTGPYWYSRIGGSSWSHWKPKMVRVDLAVDRADFPPLKTGFNPPRQRRFVYIGHVGHYKNTPYLGEIAQQSPGVEFAWIGPGRQEFPGVATLGRQDFSTEAARELVAGFDFLITVGRADANPTTILEAMAWGLIPVCTPQSGYQGVSGIVNVPLDDVTGATAVIRELQEMSDAELRRIQRENWDRLDRDFTWDQFATQVVGAIESTDAPALGPASGLRRLRLSWAAVTSPQTSPARYLPRLARARLRAWSQSAAGRRRKGHETHSGRGPDEGGPGAPDRGGLVTIDEAIRTLRQDPQCVDLVRDAYLGPDTGDSIERFARSAEFEEVVRLIGDRIGGATVLDLGAGTGIASAVFKRAGAGHVIAVEPDESEEVGRGAMRRAGLDVEIVDAVGESLPIPSRSIDIVYARQVLHHAQDLDALVNEVARVLRPGGLFIACREHVVSNDRELRLFLEAHPVHRLAGGENAFPLAAYTSAIEGSGLRIQAVLGPWDTVINAFPTVRSTAELHALPRDRLVRRFGAAGAIAARVPGVEAAVRKRIERPIPGRLYTFVATKP